MEVPQLDLLEESEPVDEADRSLTISDQAEQLLEAFSEFGIDGEIQDIDAGPTITLFAVKLARGTKVGSIRGLTEDLAHAMEVPSLRIDSNIGQGRIGIEVPNPAPELVRIREILESGKGAKMGLPMYLGKKRIWGVHGLRPHQDAPHVDRGNHRFWQIGVHQHHSDELAFSPSVRMK